MKFSIIVPVYKVEKYIKSCIDSIINQSFNDYEVILVDDGSPDSCGAICEAYSKSDGRIRVLHKENGGRLSAWKAGLNIAQGEYVVSIDSDDYVDSDFLENIDAVLNDNVEIVVYGYRNVKDEKDRGVKNLIHVPTGYYDKETIEKDIIPGLINGGSFENRSNIYLSRVNKCVKRDMLLDNSKYYECDIEYGEDNLWTVPNVLSAKGIYVMADYYPYNYRFNPQSITHSYNSGLWSKFKKLDAYLMRILRDKDFQSEVSQIYCDSVFHAAVAVNNVMYDSCDSREKIHQIREIVNDEFVKEGISLMKKDKCSFKEQMNLLLMKYKFIHLIYYIKRIQKRK